MRSLDLVNSLLHMKSLISKISNKYYLFDLSNLIIDQLYTNMKYLPKRKFPM